VIALKDAKRGAAHFRYFMLMQTKESLKMASFQQQKSFLRPRLGGYGAQSRTLLSHGNARLPRLEPDGTWFQRVI